MEPSSTTPPTHAGWVAIVPVWAWLDDRDDDEDGPVLHPRFGLPYLFLESVCFLQVAACTALGDEPHFRFDLGAITPLGLRLWRLERLVARLFGRP